MHSRADSPQFRALQLNYCSVSVLAGSNGITAGGPWAVIHEDTGAQEGRSGTLGVEAGLVFSDWGWSGGGASRGDERAGGGGSEP